MYPSVSLHSFPKVKYFWKGQGGTLSRWLFFLVNSYVAMRRLALVDDLEPFIYRTDIGRELNILRTGNSSGLILVLRSAF